MKFNTSTKTVYEVFGEENRKYVDLAIAALSKESRTISILQKRYGPKYDGVGGVRFLSYSENESLNSALRRIDSYVQGIRVLVEVYKENDEQILARFQKRNDVQILNMLRNLSMGAKPKTVELLSSKSSVLAHFGVSERVFLQAMDHIENNDHKRIYLYYYGISRSKMTIDVILELFPDYNEAQVKNVLLEIQNKLPEYIKIEQEKNLDKDLDNVPTKKKTYNRTSISKTTSYGSGFKYTSFFDYFFDKADTFEQKREKGEIVLDFLDVLEDSKRQVIKKIFGDDYNQLVPNVTLSKKEKNVFNDVRIRTRKYIQRILDIRHNNKGRAYAGDRVIFTKDNGFKEKLNMYFERKNYPLAMEIFAHYLSDHEEVKKYLSTFYDLDTLELKNNVYSSKNDAKKFKETVNEIKDYIKVCSSISRSYKKLFINYFKKPYMSDARVELVYKFILKAVDTLSDEEKKLLQLLYGEDYKTLNIYADISSNDAGEINQIIEKIGKYVSYSLENVNTFKDNIFIYFHKSGMAATYREKLDAEITRFIDNSQAKGKYIAVMLYGKTYSKLDPSVALSQEQVELFNSLLNEISEHIKSVESDLKKVRKISTSFVDSSSFLDYFSDSDVTDEENRIIIEEVKKAIDNSKHKDLFFKFYDNNYILKSNVEMTKGDKANIRYFRKQIFIKVFGNELPKNIYEMAINGRTNGDRKIRIVRETDKYLEELDGSIKDILKKVYGEDLHTFNSEAKLTNYELYIINRFNLDLNTYIRKEVPFVKDKKSGDRIEKGKLPKNFFSFLSTVDSDMTLEELTKDAKKFINKSKSKNVIAVKKLYGEEILELDESITPTEEEIKSVRFLIRDIKTRYKLQKKKSSSRVEKPASKNMISTMNLPENILDNFDITYNETNKNMIINRINFNIAARDSAFSRILHEVYGDNLTEYKCNELQIASSELALFKASTKVVNNQFTKDMSDYNLKDDLLDYFYTDLSDRDQLIKEISKQLEGLNNVQALRFKRLISFMYDSNFKLVRPMQLRSGEISAFEKIVNTINRSLKPKAKVVAKTAKKGMHLYFFDNFLFEGEEVVPESRKSMILKIVRGSKASSAKLALDLFGNNLDQECRDQEMLKANKYTFNVFIKNIIKRLTNTYSRGLFMLADNFIEQFYIDTDTDEIKEAIRLYLIHYLEASHSKYISIVNNAYDENYNLKKEYIFNGDKNSYYSFIYSIKLSVKSYRKKVINGKAKKINPKVKKDSTKQTQANLDMMDLGEKGYLALTNDLFDIRIIGNEEIEITEEELTDDVIMNAYNELMDSKTIIDLLMISEDTLIDFYLNHIDDLEDPQEAFNYLINLGNKDIIKRLMISPLFLRVINYISDIERQIIYLKLVQVSNSSLTDEIISKITKVDVNSIREYEIMTKDDKVNSLNEFIIKRK